MLKRKLDDLYGDIADDDTSSSSTNTNGSSDVPTQDISGKRVKKKKSVHFDGVTVYYFSRIQGFTCVPSEGGSTLGMASKHVHQQKFSLQEHAREQKRLHQLFLEEQRRQGLTIPEYLESKSSDEELDEDDSDFEEIDEYYFLQPLSIKERRNTLRQSGVKKIDNKEKDHCSVIRSSREHCGCDCKIFCDPESCSCSLANIQCQVDRLSFPCGCSKEGCGNLKGRIEFNPIRVRTHYVHTVMRLKLEKQEEEVPSVPSQCRFANKEGNVQNGIPEVTTGAENSTTKEEVNINEFNSNELGSCRDCQNPDVCNIMMQEVQYAALEAEQQRAALNHLYSSPQYKNMAQDTNNSAAEAPLPRVLLFNDQEENLYHADNASSFYNFKQEESSYSESSECSSEDSSGYEGTEYPKTYQTLTSFKANNNNPNQVFDSATQHTTYQQNNKKFIAMNSPHPMYKMNSITDEMAANTNDSSYADIHQADWNIKDDMFHVATSIPSPCSYTTMTNTTCDKIAEACPSISSHITNNSLDSSDKLNHYSNMGEFSCTPSSFTEKTYLNIDENTVSVSTENSEQVNHSNTSSKHHINNQSKESMADIHSFTSVVAKATQNNHTGLEIPCSKDSSCQNAGQNFGEIIKESIFETVSA